MQTRILALRPAGGHALWLRLSDGHEGTVDLSGDLEGPLFAPLHAPDAFAQARFDPELRTVVWPNGADLAPEFLIGKLLEASGLTPARKTP